MKVGRKRAPIGAQQPLIRQLFEHLGDDSFDDMAEAAGYDVSHIRGIRRGESQNPSFRTIVDLGQAVGLDLQWVRRK